MKKMNLPNKLTVIRILLVPLIIAFTLIRFPFNDLIALVLFGAAALTDLFDGKIAREQNIVTDFGKFADPLADKILVISILICFVKLDLAPAVTVIIVLFREFTVTSMRLVAAAKGKVIAANFWGKLKTVIQISAIVAIYLSRIILDIVMLSCGCWSADPGAALFAAGAVGMDPAVKTTLAVSAVIDQTLMWLVAAVTVISGVIYIKDNKDIVLSDM